MTYLIAPNKVEITPASGVVFLAGSIEMGKAERWHEKVAQIIHAQAPSLIVANPRRDHWDANLTQSIDEPVFNEQVNWELDHIDRADLVVFYFQPGTQSPITLLELGRHLARPDAATSTIVCCPPGFWRRGNVEVVMARAGLGLPLDSFDDLCRDLVEYDWAGLAEIAKLGAMGRSLLPNPNSGDAWAQKNACLSDLHSRAAPSAQSAFTEESSYRYGPHAWQKYVPDDIQRVWDDLPVCARNALVIQAQGIADREEWD